MFNASALTIERPNINGFVFVINDIAHIRLMILHGRLVKGEVNRVIAKYARPNDHRH